MKEIPREPLPERYRILEEDEDVLVIEEAGGTRRSFYPSRFRTMRLRLDQLELWGYMSPRKAVGSTPDTAFDQIISGRATLEHDTGFYVIGEPTSRSKSLRVSLHPDSGAEPGVADRRDRGLTGADEGNDGISAPPPDDDPFGPSLREASRLTPASFCYSREDASLSSEPRWWLDCRLPASAFMALSDAMSSRKLQALRLDVCLRETFIDEIPVAPPSMPVGWCLKGGSGKTADGGVAQDVTLARGAVTQLSVKLADADLSNTPHIPQEPSEANDQFTRDDPSRTLEEGTTAGAVMNLVAATERTRSTVKWVGGFIVLALLLLALR